MKHMVVSTDV